MINKHYICVDCNSHDLMFQAWVYENEKNKFVVDEIIDVSYAQCLKCNDEVKVLFLDE